MGAILSGLFISVFLNGFLFVSWRIDAKKLKNFKLLGDAIEKHDKKNKNKKGIMTVTKTTQVMGLNAPSLSYNVDIEIEELERFANGKSRIKTLRVLEVNPPKTLYESEKESILNHWNDKYIDTKNINFLEKIETNEPQFSEEDPLLIEKIDEKK